MNTRNYRTPTQTLIENARAIAKSSRDAKFIYRVTLVSLVASGIPVALLSSATGQSVNTITLWVKTADEKGFEFLRDKPQTGRQSKLTDQQKADLREVLQKDSEVYGYTRWDGKALSDYIRKVFSINLCVRQCQRLIQSLNHTR